MNISYTYVFSLYIHNPALQSPLQNILSSIPNLLEARRQNRLSILRIDRGRITGFALRIVQIGTLKNYQKIIFLWHSCALFTCISFTWSDCMCLNLKKKVEITYICSRVSRKMFFFQCCYWLYEKWPANRSDCTLQLLRMSLAAMDRRGTGCSGL